MLSAVRSVAIVSDWVEVASERTGAASPDRDGDRWGQIAEAERPWPPESAEATVVSGGYLERLPQALVASGLIDQAEIWHHWRGDAPPPFKRETPTLARRAFRPDNDQVPYASQEMLAFVREFGAPHILVVLGLGVDAALLDACAASVKIYNSIDAPALRVPQDVGARFDLVLTGAQWQSEAIAELLPGVRTEVLPIGPEFASPEQFLQLDEPKDYDLIYVAAAQPYKRHDILFRALEQLPRDIRTLCVFGYGELADDLRRQAQEVGLNIDFIGPPGVSHTEVNRLMNQARFGVVCGVDDGAPAIITEYMLAGLPVLANSALSCGLQYILPETGRAVAEDDFAEGILWMRENCRSFTPRASALSRWTWPYSVARLAEIISPIREAKTQNRALGKLGEA